MKAAVQIAERWAGLYMTVCTSENPDAATLISLIEELSAAEERERVLREALDKYEPIIIELAGRSKEAFSTIDGAMSRLIADAQNATDKRPASEWPFAALTAAPEQGKEAKS